MQDKSFSFAAEAMQLAGLGYRVFPCVPREKIPATKNGCLDASSDEETVSGWWSSGLNHNVAVSTDGLIVIDVDTPNGQPNAWGDEHQAELHATAGAIARTPRGGLHYWYRQPEGSNIRNSAGKVAPNVDIRANGGYVVVSPSLTMDGAYEWLPGCSLDFRPETIPEPPGWLLKAIASGTAITKGAASGNADGETNDTPSDAHQIIEGQRNATLTRMAGYLRRGSLNFDEIRSALRAANVTRCRPPLDDAEVDKIAKSVCRYQPNQFTTLLIEGLPGSIDKIESPPRLAKSDSLPNPGKFPAEFLTPGGLLQELMQWSIETAHKPQPELALAGALCLLSVITGRKIQDQTGIRSNIYILGLCGSGGGKDNARKCNKEILHAAGLENLIGAEGIGSHAGLHAALNVQPALLFQVDEFGRYLATLQNPTRAPHLYAVLTTLLKLYTSSDSLYKGDAVADLKRVASIDQPHAVVYGTSVPESFLESVPKSALSDGFLGRLMLIEASDDDPDEQPDAERDRPPESIVDQVRWWGNYQPGGNLSHQHPQPRKLLVGREAKAAYQRLSVVAKAEAKSGRETAAIWGRCTEKARKLGLLHQVSLDRNAPEVSVASAEWGCRMAEYMTCLLEYRTASHVSENQTEDNVKRILRIIHAAGQSGIIARDLTRKSQWIKKPERDQIIEHLHSSEQIWFALRAQPSGQSCLTYFHAEFSPSDSPSDLQQNAVQ